MSTEVPDILHNDFQFAYKYFTRQKIAKVPWITKVEQILYKQKNSCLCKKTVKSIYFDCELSNKVYYQSLKTRNIYKT